MSKASVDLPDPDTPVTTVKASRGMSTSMPRRLCSRALRTEIMPRAGADADADAGEGSATARTASAVTPSIAARYAASARPVCEVGCRSNCSGVPQATTLPPASPPSGPRSTIHSAARMTSRLCSITTNECPASSSRRNAPSNRAMSSKCSPVVGSSNRNSLPWAACPGASADPLVRARVPGCADSARCPASLRRCASPPDSVGTG